MSNSIPRLFWNFFLFLTHKKTWENRPQAPRRIGSTAHCVSLSHSNAIEVDLSLCFCRRNISQMSDGFRYFDGGSQVTEEWINVLNSCSSPSAHSTAFANFTLHHSIFQPIGVVILGNCLSVEAYRKSTVLSLISFTNLTVIWQEREKMNKK